MKTLLTLGLLTSLAFTTPVLANSEIAHHSEQSSKHSALATSHAGASTAKVASAAVAVPIAASAVVTAGAASVALKGAEVALDIAEDFSQPLVVTNVVVTADPAPNQIIEKTTTTKASVEVTETTKHSTNQPH